MARLFARRLALILLVVAFLRGGSTAWAQVPAGTEFQVNTYTTGAQTPFVFARTIAAAPDGRFVSVWVSMFQDGHEAGVFGQRFDAAGGRQGPEFRVNTYTRYGQISPTVAVGPRGEFVVAWESRDNAYGPGIFAQRYDSTGAGVGGEFLVNSTTLGDQESPAVAIDAHGNFTVVWSGYPVDIFGQRFDAAGNRIGTEFIVNTSTAWHQRRPSIDADGAGGFVVVWDHDPYPGIGSYVPFGRRFDALGTPLGPQFQISSLLIGPFARVAARDDGAFVVAWSGVTAVSSDIFARRFDSAGAPLGPEFLVDSHSTTFQYRADVDSDRVGNFVVSWANGVGPAASTEARRYDLSGTPRGPAFQVAPLGYYPGVASDAVGNFVVSWGAPDGSYGGLLGQRHGGLYPAALVVDATAGPTSDGNGVLEAGETVGAAPSWRNINGAPQTFTGAASFSGPGTPGNPIYTIPDPSASYGTVANGATASCADTADCYAVGVSVPSPRPSTHWDAALREDILPVAQGQSKSWALHVGDSFGDVPRTSGFYRFVEALLHRGVTGGCAGTQYCPSSSTTREQMAVFVLVAKEGSGYVPPACGPTPMFGDVPASSPFCRWVEELARRGVVGGCGGGNYCPTQSATREQMAVFVLRALDPALNPPACGTPVFADVPASSPFCRWIEELARRGVVTGCGGGNYCPTSAVSREQMSVFLSVTFGLKLYGV